MWFTFQAVALCVLKMEISKHYNNAEDQLLPMLGFSGRKDIKEIQLLNGLTNEDWSC